MTTSGNAAAPLAAWRRAAFLIVAAVFAIATLVAFGAGSAGARPHGFGYSQPLPFVDLGPIDDQLEILVRERELIAVDAWTRTIVATDLARQEVVTWTGVRGRVALVITDRRLLATVPGSSVWAERRFELRESEPERVLLGDRVALVVTDRRVYGFEGVTGSWSEAGLGPREHVLLSAAGTNVAVAATRTRVLGVAALRGGLFEAELGIREEVQSLRAHGSLATVMTRLRLLTFRAPDGAWQSTDLSFR